MVDGYQSRVINVVSGLPQGSVLGTLLFLLYPLEFFTFWKISWSVMPMTRLWWSICRWLAFITAGLGGKKYCTCKICLQNCLSHWTVFFCRWLINETEFWCYMRNECATRTLRESLASGLQISGGPSNGSMQELCHTGDRPSSGR